MAYLLVVGNGFDLHHGMKTKYIDYREYLLQAGHEDIVSIIDKNIETDDVYRLWNKLESVLGLVSYEQAYTYLKPYNADDWHDSFHHDFQYEVENMTHYWPGIRDQLAPWIRSIEYTKADDNLKSIVKNATLYLSFNYSNTLEVLYDVLKTDICYIHGDASKTDNLILGHRNKSYYPEWDNNQDEDSRLLEAGRIMEKHRLDTIKDVEAIITSNRSFFDKMSLIDEVYVIGLSYNDIDGLYISEIDRVNKNISWKCYCHTSDDEKNLQRLMNNIGVENYCRINIGAIIS